MIIGFSKQIHVFRPVPLWRAEGWCRTGARSSLSSPLRSTSPPHGENPPPSTARPGYCPKFRKRCSRGAASKSSATTNSADTSRQAIPQRYRWTMPSATRRSSRKGPPATNRGRPHRLNKGPLHISKTEVKDTHSHLLNLAIQAGQLPSRIAPRRFVRRSGSVHRRVQPRHEAGRRGPRHIFAMYRPGHDQCRRARCGILCSG